MDLKHLNNLCRRFFFVHKLTLAVQMRFHVSKLSKIHSTKVFQQQIIANTCQFGYKICVSRAIFKSRMKLRKDNVNGKDSSFVHYRCDMVCKYMPGLWMHTGSHRHFQSIANNCFVSILWPINLRGLFYTEHCVYVFIYLPTSPPGQDKTQGQFLSGV